MAAELPVAAWKRLHLDRLFTAGSIRSRRPAPLKKRVWRWLLRRP